MLESLFNKLAGQACNFIKTRLPHRCFAVKFAKCLRIPFFTQQLRRLLLNKSTGTSLWPHFTSCFKVFIVHLQEQGFYSSARAIETYIEGFGIDQSWVNSGWFRENQLSALSFQVPANENTLVTIYVISRVYIHLYFNGLCINSYINLYI